MLSSLIIQKLVQVVTLAIVSCINVANVHSYQNGNCLKNNQSNVHLQKISNFGLSCHDRFPENDRRRNKNIIAQYCSSSSQEDSFSDDELPSFVQSIVLKQVYPAMVKHTKEYGNPNIPLGNNDGKKCKTLRRLAFQKKLTDEEMALLEGMNFRFNSLEEVYDEADFDECLERLLKYEEEYKTNYQIPKKYKPDPELGAWVTMIRRIGRDNIPRDRREKLDAINFAWISTRKCGSSFMSNFRLIKEKLDKCCLVCQDQDTTQNTDEDCVKEVLNDVDVKKWIRAQADAAKNGNLSDARIDFMDQLPGISWRNI
eukprot:CAMPEP_0203691600 /NCGR_PEP_ID=MMETSP0091-20130426/3887_1 /ASSEMBLY_ACC=CAM_ASM_001089 /TAXON_ID=426623 /ORGANISM="Chaetoceros affinis, Strain CCMP159" /LENGTH=312 /DNA_ID=CAMNT_0050562161 /DNA_START=1 /DNA_END=939 /DNA_ORIENTATION=+